MLSEDFCLRQHKHSHIARILLKIRNLRTSLFYCFNPRGRLNKVENPPVVSLTRSRARASAYVLTANVYIWDGKWNIHICGRSHANLRRVRRVRGLEMNQRDSRRRYYRISSFSRKSIAELILLSLSLSFSSRLSSLCSARSKWKETRERARALFFFPRLNAPLRSPRAIGLTFWKWARRRQLSSRGDERNNNISHANIFIYLRRRTSE